MAENRQSDASDVIAKGANAAKTIHGAVKTGKAIAGIAKGAAAGGPYGAAAMAIWENRKTVVKIIIASSFIMILPILFILMLPSLIFGGLEDNSPVIPVMNDNAAIYANIENVSTRVHEILEAEHIVILDAVKREINALPADDEYEIIDNYDVNAALDTNVLISQYCASKDNYLDINANDLISIINGHSDNLFSWTEVVETVEITRMAEVEVETVITEYVDSVVTDSSGNTRIEQVPVQRTITVIETREETVTVVMHTYTVIFAGADYFANDVFGLNGEQIALAKDYAENLTLFLNDRSN